MNMACNSATIDRRRTFWTTKDGACGSEPSCGNECGNPGLKIVCGAGGGATFETDEYAVGLALNILLTNGRKEDSSCGHVPGTRGGHWADSFRTDGKTSGSRFRYVKATGRIQETMALLKAYATDDLKKLVDYGVAVSVSVDMKYIGGNVMSLGITIMGVTGRESRVGLIGTRLENSWVWSNN
jgi:Phage protein GP46.